MRVIVTVTEGAAQELHAELARIPSRHLAALGLALLRNPNLVLEGSQSTEGHPIQVGTPPLSSDAVQRQDTLKSKLADGLGA